MVLDLHSDVEACVRPVLLLHGRQQRLDLHDVVEGGQAEQRGGCFQAIVRPRVAARAINHLVEEVPVRALQKVGLPLGVAHVDEVLGHVLQNLRHVCGFHDIPVFVDTVHEAHLPVKLKAEQPIDCKEGAHRPLVLHGTEAAPRGASTSFKPEQAELRETSQAIVMVVAEGVAGRANVGRQPAYPVPAGPSALQGLDQDCIRLEGS
mmetsp:Transcript_73502/g.202901  ORF Transcript_73502/g.202901 Transcript_73502/m.202901 type:complete len:206 (+) Transcript_73502:1255-1872(+)